MAARCSKEKPQLKGPSGGVAVFPAAEWGDRELAKLVPPDRPDLSSEWELVPPWAVELKNLGEVELSAIVRNGIWRPSETAEHRAAGAMEAIRADGAR
jgi:hypothetical protein